MDSYLFQSLDGNGDSNMARPLLVEVLSDKRTDLLGIYCVWYCVSHKKRNSSQIATQQCFVVKFLITMFGNEHSL